MNCLPCDTAPPGIGLKFIESACIDRRSRAIHPDLHLSRISCDRLSGRMSAQPLPAAEYTGFAGRHTEFAGQSIGRNPCDRSQPEIGLLRIGLRNACGQRQYNGQYCFCSIHYFIYSNLKILAGNGCPAIDPPRGSRTPREEHTKKLQTHRDRDTTRSEMVVLLLHNV